MIDYSLCFYDYLISSPPPAPAPPGLWKFRNCRKNSKGRKRKFETTNTDTKSGLEAGGLKFEESHREFQDFEQDRVHDRLDKEKREQTDGVMKIKKKDMTPAGCYFLLDFLREKPRLKIFPAR